MRRRALLVAVGATATTAAIGRFASPDDRLDATMRLGWLGTANFDADPHQFELRVERDGEQVHHSSHEVRGQDGNVVHGAVADCTWGSAPGEYTVFARVDGGEWTERSSSDFESYNRADVTCGVAEVRYRSETCEIAFRETCDQIPEYDGGCAFADDRRTESDR